jgi:phosphoribosyl 1,2-cyclic phosphodiesterase
MGTPNPIHLMQPPDDSNRLAHSISNKANVGDPRYNKNYRCNPSILIHHRDIISQKHNNVLIDMGKTFRESVIRWFPPNHISSVDAVILTHGHADAIFGLDDIRGVQSHQKYNNHQSTPVYLSQDCLDVVRRVFSYLFPSEIESPNKVIRFVSNISWNIISPYAPFKVCNIEFKPIPVIHGEDLISMGYLFGKNTKVCYLSDISRMPNESLEYIKKNGPIDILIVDALCLTYEHPTHYSVYQAIALIEDIKPTKSYLIGMSSSIDHEETNEMLKKFKDSHNIDVQLSYDGLVIDFDL